MQDNGNLIIVGVAMTPDFVSVDRNAAFADAGMIMFLAQSVAGEPTLISHLVRIAILEQALQVIWQGLTENKWSN